MPPLPTPLTSFIGHAATLADLVAMMRQSDVHLLAPGKSNPEIATELFLTTGTTKS